MIYSLIILAITSLLSAYLCDKHAYGWAVITYVVSVIPGIWLMHPSHWIWVVVGWFVYSCIYTIAMILWSITLGRRLWSSPV